MLKKIILIGVAALLATVSVKAQTPVYGTVPVTVAINNANIGQFQSTNAFTGSTNYGNAPLLIGALLQRNVALSDTITPATNSAGATNTYVFVKSLDGINWDFTAANQITWVHPVTQSAGIVLTNYTAITNIAVDGVGYLGILSYAVTTGTNQTKFQYAVKQLSP